MKRGSCLAVILLLTACVSSPHAFAGVINFSPGLHGTVSFTETITVAGPGAGATATFDNPFTESANPFGAANTFFYADGLVLGSGTLPLSFDVTFSETVALTEVSLGDPIITFLGFNVTGEGVSESALLASQAAGNYVLESPLVFLKGEAYTFSSVNRNVTPPITSSGGTRFSQWTFGAPPTNPVPEPTSLAIFGIGALGLVFRRPRRS